MRAGLGNHTASTSPSPSPGTGTRTSLKGGNAGLHHSRQAPRRSTTTSCSVVIVCTVGVAVVLTLVVGGVIGSVLQLLALGSSSGSHNGVLCTGGCTSSRGARCHGHHTHVGVVGWAVVGLAVGTGPLAAGEHAAHTIHTLLHRRGLRVLVVRLLVVRLLQLLVAVRLLGRLALGRQPNPVLRGLALRVHHAPLGGHRKVARPRAVEDAGARPEGEVEVADGAVEQHGLPISAEREPEAVLLLEVVPHLALARLGVLVPHNALAHEHLELAGLECRIQVRVVHLHARVVRPALQLLVEPLHAVAHNARIRAWAL